VEGATLATFVTGPITMIIIGVLLNVVGLGVFCWALFALAIHALPFFVLCGRPHKIYWTKPLRGRQQWRRTKEGSGTECAAAALTILRCASRRPTRGLAEQVAGDVDYRKTSPFFRVRFKICLHKNLDGLLTGMNFDAYRRVVKLHFISATILSSDNRVRHFYATSGPAS
jgi:hypothetical protein